MANTAVYIQRGETLDYKNSTDAAILAGTVVLFGDRIGVAGGEIPAGAVGALHVTGVFEIPKKASIALSMGDAVVYTEADGIDKAAAAASPIGYAVAASGADEAAATVKLLG